MGRRLVQSEGPDESLKMRRSLPPPAVCGRASIRSFAADRRRLNLETSPAWRAAAPKCPR